MSRLRCIGSCTKCSNACAFTDHPLPQLRQGGLLREREHRFYPDRQSQKEIHVHELVKARTKYRPETYLPLGRGIGPLLCANGLPATATLVLIFILFRRGSRIRPPRRGV